MKYAQRQEALLQMRRLILKPSAMSQEQLLLLKKSMSKKAYQQYWRQYRSQQLLGRNYGTRTMSSAKDYSRKGRSPFDEGMEY